jgi:flagellar secretion chaperone FliS
MRAVANAYLETQVMTASPERLHLMVVDAAIRFARQGQAALEARYVEAAFLALDHCRTCVTEILGGINGELNTELAERLKGLFVFVQRNLVLADVERNPQYVRDALTVLESHRRTWEALMDRLQQERSTRRGPRDEAVAENSWMT